MCVAPSLVFSGHTVDEGPPLRLVIVVHNRHRWGAFNSTASRRNRSVWLAQEAEGASRRRLDKIQNARCEAAFLICAAQARNNKPPAGARNFAG